MRIKVSTLQKMINEALENAYDVLGVAPGATPREIKAAWARLVHDARSARVTSIGTNRGGHHAAEINYYGRAVRAALANAADPTVPPMFEPKEVKPPPEPRAPRAAPTAAPVDDVPFDVADVSPAGRRARKAKETYKVYGMKDGSSAIRVQNKLYGTLPGGDLGDGSKTMFGKNDRVGVEFDPELDGRIKVRDGDHVQTWNPVEEVRRLIDEMVIESLIRS